MSPDAAADALTRAQRRAEAADAPAGWAYPSETARKAHYFDEGRSMCGHWLWLGPTRPGGTFSETERCKGCQGKLS